MSNIHISIQVKFMTNKIQYDPFIIDFTCSRIVKSRDTSFKKHNNNNLEVKRQGVKVNQGPRRSGKCFKRDKLQN